MQSVSIEKLKFGTRLRFPLFDQNDVLLLAVGQVIEPSFLQKLRNRGIGKVKIDEREMDRVLAGKPQGQSEAALAAREGSLCQAKNAVTETLDRLVSEDQLGLPEQGEAFAKQVAQRGATGFDSVLESEIVDNHVQSVGQMDSIFESIDKGQEMDVEQVGTVSEMALSYVSEDPDLFACLGINPHSGTYPARHSVHTQMLAVAVGIQMGLDRPTLKELAIGCLIHDSGMLKIDQSLYNRQKPLSDVEFLEITKHPICTFDMIMKNQSVSSRSAFIAYQIHERCNGNGYPRRRTGNQIHFLAKIAGVADAFTALVTPRPHREGMLPYKAMETMIFDVKRGLFDADAVRALLWTTSLFPLGSYVEISDGRVGRVIRANGQDFGNPVVEVWLPGQSENQKTIVDLSREPNLKVKRPLGKLP